MVVSQVVAMVGLCEEALVQEGTKSSLVKGRVGCAVQATVGVRGIPVTGAVFKRVGVQVVVQHKGVNPSFPKLGVDVRAGVRIHVPARPIHHLFCMLAWTQLNARRTH